MKLYKWEPEIVKGVVPVDFIPEHVEQALSVGFRTTQAEAIQDAVEEMINELPRSKRENARAILGAIQACGEGK